MTEDEVYNLPIRYILKIIKPQYRSINPEWDPNLVAYYQLDESSKIHYDLAKNRLDFEYQAQDPIIDNSPRYSATKGNFDPFDVVLKLDTNAIVLPVWSDFCNTPQWTIELWFLIENLAQNDYPLVGVGSKPIYEGFTIVYSKTSGKLFCNSNSASNSNPLLITPFTPTVNKWHHVSCTMINGADSYSQLTVDNNIIVTTSFQGYSLSKIYLINNK